jgi:hypothetical protein
MKLSEYIKNLQNLVDENPELNDAVVVYAIDDEGNGYGEVCHTPGTGLWNSEDREYCCDENIKKYPEDYEWIAANGVKALIIN